MKWNSTHYSLTSPATACKAMFRNCVLSGRPEPTHEDTPAMSIHVSSRIHPYVEALRSFASPKRPKAKAQLPGEPERLGFDDPLVSTCSKCGSAFIHFHRVRTHIDGGPKSHRVRPNPL